MQKRCTRASRLGLILACASGIVGSACSSEPSAPPAGADAATSGTGTGTGTGTAGPATGTITFTITRDGADGGVASEPLSVGAFTENPPKSRPPVVFDTTKTPAFPYAGSLKGLEPGRYWVVAVLDRPPVSLGSVKPGPEDLMVTSEEIVITGGDSRAVSLSFGNVANAADASTRD